MSEPKTKCSECGRSILQRTADKRNGLCAPCHNDAEFRAEMFAPDNFLGFPGHLAERLRKIGLEPHDYRDWAWQEQQRSSAVASEALERLVEHLEDRAANYREWFPKLREYADECQRQQPFVHDWALDCAQSAQQSIYLEKLDAQAPAASTHSIAVCCMPIIGISAVSEKSRTLDLEDSALVFLTPEEFAHWNSIYPRPESDYWWNIDNDPDPNNYPDLQLDGISENESAWLVDAGVCWNPASGATELWATGELWAWNGQSVRHVAELWRDMS